MYTLLFWMVHCGIWDKNIVGFGTLVYSYYLIRLILFPSWTHEGLHRDLDRHPSSSALWLQLGPHRVPEVWSVRGHTGSRKLQPHRVSGNCHWPLCLCVHSRQKLSPHCWARGVRCPWVFSSGISDRLCTLYYQWYCCRWLEGVYRKKSGNQLSWASCQIRKIAGRACAGNVGNVFPTFAG